MPYIANVIRNVTAEDWPAIWPIYAQMVRAADTFSYDPEIGEDAARDVDGRATGADDCRGRR